jgi:hypothetical protein
MRIVSNILLFLLLLVALKSEAQVIYQDDFNNMSGWKSKYTSASFATDVSVAGGNLILNPYATDNWFQNGPEVSIDFTKDFTIEASMAVYSDNPKQDTYYGIMFGASSNLIRDNLFIITEDGYAKVTSYTTETNTRVEYQKFAAIKKGSRIFNKIKIVKKGSEVYFYTNDVEFAKVSNLEMYGNRIAFKVSAAVAVAVDYLVVRYGAETPATSPSSVALTNNDYLDKIRSYNVLNNNDKYFLSYTIENDNLVLFSNGNPSFEFDVNNNGVVDSGIDRSYGIHAGTSNICAQFIISDVSTTFCGKAPSEAFGSHSNGTFKLTIPLNEVSQTGTISFHSSFYDESTWYVFFPSRDYETDTKSNNFRNFRKKYNYQIRLGDKDAPEIAITSPSVTRGLKVTETNKKITITGKATDESGIYEVMVNSIEAKVDASGNFSATVPLAIGENNFTVTATDIKMNKSDYSFTVSRTPADNIETPIIPVSNTEMTQGGKYYALIIGIEDYQDATIPDLEEPVRDASSLSNILNTKYTFEKENIRLLKNPTRYQVFQALEALSKKVKESDNLLIFYAGHGYWDEQRRQGYWFPSDGKRTDRSSWITNADLKEYISTIPSKHTLLITDACFAGSIFKSRSIVSSASMAVKQLYELPSRKAMTSGSLKEVPDKSVFIEYLVKRLSQNAEKFLSAEQLFSSFRTAVINNSANGQVPQYGEIKEAGDEGGDFIFIKR